MNPSIEALTQAKNKAEKNLELLEGELLVAQNAVKNLTADIEHYKDSIDKLTPAEPINHWVGPPKPKEMEYQIGDVFKNALRRRMIITGISCGDQAPYVTDTGQYSEDHLIERYLLTGGPTYEKRKNGNS